MALNLTDAQLRASLKELGFDAGPITESTRSVYEKKLLKLMEQPKLPQTSSPTRQRRGRSHMATPNEAEELSKKTGEARVHQIRVDPSTDHVSSTLVPGSARLSEASSKDATFSSHLTRRTVSSRLTDESFTKVPSSTSTATIEPTIYPSVQSPSSYSVVSRTLSNSGDYSTSTQIPSTESYFNRPVTPQRGAGHTPTRKTYIYYSNGANEQTESDTDDEVRNRSPFSGTISRVTGWLRKGAEQTVSNSRSIGSNLTGRYTYDREPVHDGQIQVSDTDQSDVESRHRSPFFRGLQSPSSAVGRARDAGTATSKSLLFTPPRSSSKTYTSPGRLSPSILSDDNDDNWRYRDGHGDTSDGLGFRDRQTTHLWSRYLSSSVSHIPNLILLCSIVLLFFLAMSYFILKDHHGEVGKMADLQKVICSNTIPEGVADPVDTHKCLRQSDVDEALPVLGITFDVLSRYAGEYHCQQNHMTSPRMSVISASGLVRLHADASKSLQKDFHIVWKHVLFLILHVGRTHFGINSYNTFGKEIGSGSEPHEVSELESLQPYFSGTCRIRRLIAWLGRMCITILGLVLSLVLFIGFVLLLRWIRTNRIQAAEQRSARIRDLVAEVVHMLQQQLRENEVNSEQPPYIPVCVLRKRLQQENSDAIKLWPEVVRYVYDVETCIGVQEWRGVGETWQWQGGTGWQGSALADKSQKSPFVTPPTECLKIRNMFATESLDERGKRRIKRELLKRLVSCGPILHIGLDRVGTKGLVYVKCANTDTAGRVYHAIHANYFDGRLLTVKFLRDTKYCLRFPEAHMLTRPLCLSDLE